MEIIHLVFGAVGAGLVQLISNEVSWFKWREIEREGRWASERDGAGESMELSRLAASGFRRIIQVLGSQMLRHLINAERETNSPSRTVARKRQVAKKKERCQ